MTDLYRNQSKISTMVVCHTRSILEVVLFGCDTNGNYFSFFTHAEPFGAKKTIIFAGQNDFFTWGRKPKNLIQKTSYLTQMLLCRSSSRTIPIEETQRAHNAWFLKWFFSFLNSHTPSFLQCTKVAQLHDVA